MTMFYPLKPDQRVWVEQPILNTIAVTELQACIGKSLHGFVPADPADLHVTLVHLGKPRRLYDELIAAGARLDYAMFTRLLQDLLATAAAAVRSSLTVVAVEELSIFGPDHHLVLVARLASEPRWLQYREPILGELYKLILDCGLHSPLRFMRSSTNLSFMPRDSFRPHVTLGTVPDDTIITGLTIPPADLELGPTRLRGV